jgi:hypothetical protein
LHQAVAVCAVPSSGSSALEKIFVLPVGHQGSVGIPFVWTPEAEIAIGLPKTGKPEVQRLK